MQACLAIVIGKRLSPLDKIQVLLHLDMDLLRLLLVFIDDLGQATIVGLLLLLLLSLRAIGHTDLTIVINLLLQVFGLLIHLFCLLIDALSKVVIVHVRSNLVFLLHECAQVVLVLGELPLDFHIGLAELVWEQSLHDESWRMVTNRRNLQRLGWLLTCVSEVFAFLRLEVSYDILLSWISEVSNVSLVF